jgi:hypothetical protein
MTVCMGMIGAGRMSNTRANCLAKIFEAKIVAVADVIGGSADVLLNLHGTSQLDRLFEQFCKRYS